MMFQTVTWDSSMEHTDYLQAKVIIMIACLRKVRCRQMMEYGDFYDIAVYANDNWKGNFSQKEIATNAYNYLVDFEYSDINATVEPAIQDLIELLLDDWYNDSEGKTEVEDWLWNICIELGLTDDFKAKAVDDERFRKFVNEVMSK